MDIDWNAVVDELEHLSDVAEDHSLRFSIYNKERYLMHKMQSDIYKGFALAIKAGLKDVPDV